MDIIVIYQADTYCVECGHIISRYINNSRTLADWQRKDSDHYPQEVMNSEADTPQHCARCGVFLENPLTTDGVKYVREKLKSEADSPTVQEWGSYYGLTD